MKKYLMLLSVAGSLVFSSCLKDKNVTDKVYGTSGLEDIKTVDIPSSPDKVLSYNATDELQTLTVFTVHLNSAAPADKDITVTLAPDPEALAAYNTENETEYEEIPSSIYELVGGLTVTIPKGSRSADVVVKLKTQDLIAGPYILALKIASISDASFVVSGNYSEIAVVLGAKNKFDGVYTLRIRTTGWAAYGIADGTTFNYPEEYQLETKGVDNNAGFSTYRGDYLLPALTTAGGPTGFGATTPVFYFDVTTNKLVDVKNSTPDDGRGRKLKINPAVTDSRFDPDTKKIYAAFIMGQNGRPDQYFYDTLTYVKER